MFKKLKKLFTLPTLKNVEYNYLAEATDIVDLERRQRQMDRGCAPWQQTNLNLKGWV